jgi:DNA-binding transcriptional ArsR family regulator
MARPPASEDPFRAIADPTRRKIIELLASRPHTAGELASSFATCQSTVSEHLGILRGAGLVTFTEEASRRIYRLTPSRLSEVAAWSSRYAPAARTAPALTPIEQANPA